MNKMILTTISAAAFLFVAEVNAQGMGGGGQRERPEFATVDTDSNSILSAAELEAAGATGMLARMDADENGELSLEEFNTRPPGGGQRPGR